MNNNQGEVRSSDNARRNTAIGLVIGMMLGSFVDLYTGDLGIATILGMVLGGLIGYYRLGRVHLMEYPQGVLTRVVIAGVIFFIVLFGTYYLLERETNQLLRSILPFAPALPGLFLFISIGYAFSKLDELQRKIQIEAIAIGFGITAIVSLTYGLLGLTGTPQPNWTLVPVIMTFSLLIGKLWTRWKYR
jgi:cell shape-determining protein MreD